MAWVRSWPGLTRQASSACRRVLDERIAFETFVDPARHPLITERRKPIDNAHHQAGVRDPRGTPPAAPGTDPQQPAAARCPLLTCSSYAPDRPVSQPSTPLHRRAKRFQDRSGKSPQRLPNSAARQSSRSAVAGQGRWLVGRRTLVRDAGQGQSPGLASTAGARALPRSNHRCQSVTR